ncbi:MAG: TonB-dependent hemoglobin/transferrin/lactoferrin family receptor [Gammaproteobacteria bacterium]|jgi:hemoglobin/transferrin/lactoferrin receptor protein|nr:MAG: TonB-dependent hemoglobin/transferrin/lactoferrin family receptor [Gammaproteobacteria bacterium]
MSLDSLFTGSVLAVAVALCLSPLSEIRAEDSSSAADFTEEILVVGARMPRTADNVVGKVDVIRYQDLVDQMASSLSDATRYTPGVSVVTADSRFGETEITIRGLSGNRVASLIDGVPIPDQFDVGSFANAGQDFLVADAVSRIEVLRGPASTLFGNDALGGVFAIVTRDPQEYLNGRSSHVGGSAAWSGRDDSAMLNGSLALGGEVGPGALDGVLHLSRKDGHEVNRSAVDEPDAQDRTQKSAYLKTGYTLASGNRIRLDASAFDEHVLTDMVSVLGQGRQFRNTTGLNGDDERQRYAATLGYDFQADRAWLNSGRVNLYWQQVSVEQNTEDLRAPIGVLNERQFKYDTDTLGLTLDFDSQFATRRSEHRLAWGLSFESSEIEEQRDGRSHNLETGESTNWMLGEVMPLRDFPKSKVDEFALYLHDEISIGRFTVIPGLRYQSYDLDARVDAIYLEDNPTTNVVDAKESSLAPKLGALWHFDNASEAYFQYAHGFRAPPFEDLNIGLNIPLFGYQAIPNPDLVPETSDGIEIGYRYRGDQLRWSIAAFGVDYEDLIETKVNLGRNPDTGILTFQSQNIDRARVYGAEFTFNYSFDRWVSGLSLDAAASITRGDNRTTDEPLNTVDPAELVTALIWEPNARWRLGMIVTAVAAKDRVDETTAGQMTTDGYAILDLTASWQISRSIRLDAGLFNAFDKTYWQWSSVRNRTENDPMINYLSAPGRYGSVAVRMSL